ncbi:MAG: multicomponent K+:H+ antiporter subunit A [Urechidicola sp.]|jgi:multicomponent Na+:H+ antiporter subunit D
MNWQNTLPLLIVLSALIPGLIIFLIDEQRRGLRTLVNFGGAVVCISMIVALIIGVYQGQVFETRLPLLPNIDLVLHADPLSLLFVGLSGVLWFLTTIYAIGYLEYSPNRSRFFGFFSFCVSATMGVALAGNLITFVIFYELLTLTTYPLVVHKGNPASIRAGRTYLIYTMLGGALLLAGVVWLKAMAGSLDFTATGILAGMPGLDPFHLQIIFVLLIAGLGVKAALVPFHGWLPVAMAAPAPVSALLHAVAVVKAGAFGIVRVVYDVYGIEFAHDLGLTMLLAALASFTIIYGSTCAIFQDDLKKRLAYSTISQVSYIALGTAIAGPIATIGGIAHLVHQGLMKITMFFCAGNLAETLGIHKVSQMDGVGRRMPLTMGAFSLAALGMIGVPPAAGFVSKWYLGVGALEVQAYWVIGVLALSSLLNAVYFLPVLYAVWFKPQSGDWPTERKFGRAETHWMLLLPPVITAVLALGAGLFAGAALSPLTWVELIAAREYGKEVVQTVQVSLLPTPKLWWIIVIPLLAAFSLANKFLQKQCLWLMPLAALPALVVALISPDGDNSLPWLFFGSIIGLDATSQVFLLLAALLWFLAGLYARDYLRNDPNSFRFTLFFLLTMSGNFGLILAQDMFGFITFFTLMSFAAYGLVIHSGSDEARRAAKTYIQWVVIGEVLLFAALTGLSFSGGGSNLRELDLASQPYWVSCLLLAGFGIKAGLFSVHVWLPRAHPVAPIPASALLSGIMVKAGLLGWIKFLPLGMIALDGAGEAMILLGLGGAFLAVVAGLLQHNPKTLLAYSTLSQMGIISAGVGIGLLDPALWPALLPALLVYAFHHGLAKAALFMSVGFTTVLKESPYRKLVWAGIWIPALALAGLPFSSGAIAKTAYKQSVVDYPLLTTLLALTAIGTTCLVLRFLKLMQNSAAASKSTEAPGVLQFVAFALLFTLVVGAVYFLPISKAYISEVFTLGAMWSSLWPVLAGVTLYWLTQRFVSGLKPLPAGDIGLVYEWFFNGLKHLAISTGAKVKRSAQSINLFSSRESWINKDSALTPWPAIYASATQPGIVFIAVLCAVIVALGLQFVLAV